MPGGEAVFFETHERFAVQPTREFAAEANRLFGDQTYYATVDTSLPEPKRKAWEKNQQWRRRMNSIQSEILNPFCTLHSQLCS